MRQHLWYYLALFFSLMAMLLQACGDGESNWLFPDNRDLIRPADLNAGSYRLSLFEGSIRQKSNEVWLTVGFTYDPSRHEYRNCRCKLHRSKFSNNAPPIAFQINVPLHVESRKGIIEVLKAYRMDGYALPGGKRCDFETQWYESSDRILSPFKIFNVGRSDENSHIYTGSLISGDTKAALQNVIPGEIALFLRTEETSYTMESVFRYLKIKDGTFIANDDPAKTGPPKNRDLAAFNLAVAAVQEVLP